MLVRNKIRQLLSKPWSYLVIGGLAVAALAILPLLEALSVEVNGGRVVLAAVVLGLSLIVVATTFMDLGAVETDETKIASRLTLDPQAHELIRRWVIRVRWYRYVGGAAGLMFAIGWTGHFVLFGMAGIMVGAVLSESARIGKPVDGPRKADLTARPVQRYVSGGQQYVLYLIAGLGLVTATIAISQGDLGRPFYGSLGAITLITIVLVAQWRVVVRSRPALPKPIRRADDQLRYLANTRSLADPAMALGFALLAEISGTWATPEGSNSFVVADAVELVFFILALGVWWQNRRLGLHSLSDALPVSESSPAGSSLTAEQAKVSLN